MRKSRTPREISIVYTLEEGWWVAEAPFLRGAYGQGRTRPAARKSVLSAIRDLLETYAAMGKRPPFAKVAVQRTKLVA